VGQADAIELPRFAGLRTFARLPRLEDVGEAAVAVLGAPFDSATTFRPGARFGPAGIREASLLLRSYNEPLATAPFASIQVADAGDAPASPLDVAAAHQRIYDEASKLTRKGTRVLGLGGDHSVSLPLMRATAEAHGQLSVLHFDSHMDTWESHFHSRYTHGTVFRRALEEGAIDPASSIQVGLRGSLYDAEDLPNNAALGFHTVLAREFDVLGVAAVFRRIEEVLRPPIYVSVDIDVLDPAFAPGTGTPESGGLSSRELLTLLRSLGDASLPPVGADVVEVAPPYDHASVTAIAASNAAFELVSLLVMGCLTSADADS
jgi:agmatinase